MDKRVVITGLGVVTPIGNNVTDFWNNMINGVCGLDQLIGFEEYDCPVKIVGQIKNFDPSSYGIDPGSVRRSDLYSQYALASAQQAVKDSGIESGINIDPERFGVYVGSGIGGINTFMKEAKKLFDEGAGRISPLFVPMMISNIASGNIAIRYNAQGPCLPIVTACATGTHSAGEAYRAIKHGYADALITGGAEAAVHPIAIGGFANSKALSRSTNPLEASLPFDKRREGFVIAEGSGILVFEEMEHAIKRGANIYAEVCGYGNSCDAYHYTAPRPDAKAASKAMRIAIGEKDISSMNIYINAHGTGTPLNDKTETLAIKLALGDELAKRAVISSTKSMTGHMLGASGGVELIATTLSLKHNIVAPTIGLKEKDPECDLDYNPNVSRDMKIDFAMSNSLGFGGHNSCISLKRMD